jgi:hypothetical protein
MAIRNKKSFFQFQNKLLSWIFHPKILPFTFTFIALAVLFVMFRMKGIEQAYQLNNLTKEIDRALIVNKELKASRARLMSVNRLRDHARDFNLKEPGPEQIILIP